MPTNYIDSAISQEQLDGALAGFKATEDALPQLIDLNAEQRKKMTRYSDKDLGAILKAFNLAEQHPEILPASFNFEAMRRDVDALQKLAIVRQAGIRTLGRIEDSHYAAGSESKSHLNAIYAFLKTHHALTGDLEDALAELSRHFAHKSSKPDKS